jgi:hypothetical protein
MFDYEQMLAVYKTHPLEGQPDVEPPQLSSLKKVRSGPLSRKVLPRYLQSSRGIRKPVEDVAAGHTPADGTSAAANQERLPDSLYASNQDLAAPFDCPPTPRRRAHVSTSPDSHLHSLAKP